MTLNEIPVGKDEQESESEDDTIFVLSREDVYLMAEQMGLSRDLITPDVMEKVKDGVEWGLEYWSEVMRIAIQEALAKT